MNEETKRRTTYRRFSDRRVAALLKLYEILFYETEIDVRTSEFFKALAYDFMVDRVLLIKTENSDEQYGVDILYAYDPSDFVKKNCFKGKGIKKLLETQKSFDGALTLSKYRTSSFFSRDEWAGLWSEELGCSSSALLSVKVTPRSGENIFLWLIMDSGSREWSSHDRDLCEEEALLLSKVLERDLLDIKL
ncbi:MAG: hypothetical protein JXR91_15285 [Deltaproteobacteria bacterium]|nr:hypothetical protein [Deltaproteobacteria bacterium]